MACAHRVRRAEQGTESSRSPQLGREPEARDARLEKERRSTLPGAVFAVLGGADCGCRAAVTPLWRLRGVPLSPALSLSRARRLACTRRSRPTNSCSRSRIGAGRRRCADTQASCWLLAGSGLDPASSGVRLAASRQSRSARSPGLSAPSGAMLRDTQAWRHGRPRRHARVPEPGNSRSGAVRGHSTTAAATEPPPFVHPRTAQASANPPPILHQSSTGAGSARARLRECPGAGFSSNHEENRALTLVRSLPQGRASACNTPRNPPPFLHPIPPVPRLTGPLHFSCPAMSGFPAQGSPARWLPLPKVS
jgi:hypothetical protein